MADPTGTGSGAPRSPPICSPPPPPPRWPAPPGAPRHFSTPDRVIRPWQVRRIYEKGLLPDPPRAGMYRMILPAALPAVEAALRRLGYLPGADAGRPAGVGR